MPMHPAKDSMTSFGFRLAGVLVLLLAVLAIVRSRMMSMAAMHELMSAIGV